MNIKESKTYLNLAKAFAGESQAHIRYKFVEYCARNEGYSCMAEIIDKLVYNEFQHARMFYTALQQGSNETIENIDICSGYPFKQKWDLLQCLEYSAQDENNECSKIYPTYAKIAREEGFEDEATLFDQVAGVELCHKKLFTDLYNQLKSKTLYKKDHPVKWKCSHCGYEETSNAAWKCCPLCEAKQGAVMLKLNDGN